MKEIKAFYFRLQPSGHTPWLRKVRAGRKEGTWLQEVNEAEVTEEHCLLAYRLNVRDTNFIPDNLVTVSLKKNVHS